MWKWIGTRLIDKCSFCASSLQSLEHEFQSRAAIIHRSRAIKLDQDDSSDSPDHRKFQKDARRLVENNTSLADRLENAEKYVKVIELELQKEKLKTNQLEERLKARTRASTSATQEQKGLKQVNNLLYEFAASVLDLLP